MGSLRAVMKKKAAKLIAAIGINFLLALFCACAQAKGDSMTLEDFAISPDGSVVAFQYIDNESHRHGLGLLEWKTGKLTPIPAPPGKHLGSASFSYDGKRLVAMMSDATSGEIVSIDLATLQITSLAQARRGWQRPVLQPGTDNILFIEGEGASIYFKFNLLNPKVGKVTTVLEEKEGFVSGIFFPSFVGPDEFIFQAITPVDPQLRQAVVDLVGNKTETMAYRMKIGGKPEIILKDITAYKKNKYDEGISFATASRNGKVIVFIGMSRTEPRTKRGAFNFEIFKLEDGKLTQMTDLQTHMSYARVSYDGSTVAFGTTVDRTNARHVGVDLSVLDLRTGTVTATRLLETLQARSDFKLTSQQPAKN